MHLRHMVKWRNSSRIILGIGCISTLSIGIDNLFCVLFRPYHKKKTSSCSYSYFDHNHHARFTSSSRLIEGHLRSCVEHLSVEWRSMLLTDMSTDSKTGIGRLSTDTHVGRYSVDTRPILNRHSAENWPILYRHCYWVLSYLIKYELIFSSLAILFFCIPCGKGRGDGCCF